MNTQRRKRRKEKLPLLLLFNLPLFYYSFILFYSSIKQEKEDKDCTIHDSAHSLVVASSFILFQIIPYLLGWQSDRACLVSARVLHCHHKHPFSFLVLSLSFQFACLFVCLFLPDPPLFFFLFFSFILLPFPFFRKENKRSGVREGESWKIKGRFSYATIFLYSFPYSLLFEQEKKRIRKEKKRITKEQEKNKKRKKRKKERTRKEKNKKRRNDKAGTEILDHIVCYSNQLGN